VPFTYRERFRVAPFGGRSHYLASASLAVSLLTLMLAQSRPADSVSAAPVADTLRVREIVIVNESGKICGVLRGEKDGLARLRLGSDSDHALLELAADRSHVAALSIRDSNGQDALVARLVNNKGAELALADVNGKRRIEACTTRTYSNVSLFSPEEERVINVQSSAFRDNSLPRTEKGGRPTFHLGVCGAIDSTNVSIFAKGTPRSMFLAGAGGGGPYLWLYGTDHTIRLEPRGIVERAFDDEQEFESGRGPGHQAPSLPDDSTPSETENQ
jgi:hypothetical protein